MSGAGIAVVAAAFFAGAIPFSYLIARLRGVDIRTVGSGNIGATNLARAAGPVLGVTGLLLDALKGAAAVLLACRAGGGCGSALASAAGLAAVAGHMFTPFLRFRGGKGVATGAGVFAVLAPLPLAAAFAVFVVTVALGRMVSLGSVLAALALAPAAHLLGAPRPVVAAAAVLAVVTTARHAANLRRIARGTENRLGAGKGA